MHRLTLLTFCLWIPVSLFAFQHKNSAVSSCSEKDFESYTRFLSSDELQGRAVGSVGGEKAAFFIAEQFQKMDLSPAKSGYLLPVPLYGMQFQHKHIRFEDRNGKHNLQFNDDDIWVYSEQIVEQIKLSASIVFLGYGIQAPEHGFKDYEPFNVRGKVVLVLDGLPKNTPTLTGPQRTALSDRRNKIFNARSHGASGILIIGGGKPKTASEQFIPSWSNGHRLTIIGQISPDLAEKIFSSSQLNYKDLQNSPQPLHLDLLASFELSQLIRVVGSPNVVAILKGTTNEAVLFTAHYDGLGQKDEGEDEDKIFNGAHDNASGIAAMLCLARKLRSHPTKFRRTAIFLATTAEEKGALGVEFYSMYPIIPLQQTVMVLNIDGINIMGKGRDYIALGISQTDQEHNVTNAITQTGLSHRIDARLEDGMLLSFDTKVFLSRGVPAITVWPGFEFSDLSEAEVKEKYNQLRARYHSVDDEVDSTWNWFACMQHLEILEALARNYLSSSEKAAVKSESIFRSIALSQSLRRLPEVYQLLLPFKQGTSHKLVQGWNGKYGHSNAAFYSYDFLMDIGTEVIAAREGIVAHVEESYEDENRIAGKENVIVIAHTDGMFSRYYHLTHDGSKVAIGDAVSTGQIIGYSGDTGASAGPHLHFDITVGCYEWGCQTIPIEFRNSSENPLISGRLYTALP